MLMIEPHVSRKWGIANLHPMKVLVRFSSANPVLAPTGLDEGINTSDAEVVEFGGKTFVYFAVGDQLTWMNVKRGKFDGTLQ